MLVSGCTQAFAIAWLMSRPAGSNCAGSLRRTPAVFALQSGRAMRFALLVVLVTACTADVDIYREPDLDNDDELAMYRLRQ